MTMRTTALSKAQAIVEASMLRSFVLERGVKTVSIELVEGRGGSGWLKKTWVASLGHHTVSKRSNGDTPVLKICKVGRTGLPGPLCNGYGGFDEVARIVCMAWANHPGEGGPTKVEKGTIPKNNGRAYLFGWEFEGGIDLADFTPSYRTFMAQCLAGTLDYLDATSLSHHEHKTWAPKRKVDRLGYTLEMARKEIDDLEVDEMTLTQARIELAAAWRAKSGEWMTGSMTETAQARLSRLADEVATKKRTVEAIVAFAPAKVAVGAGGEAVPAWILDPTGS